METPAFEELIQSTKNSCNDNELNKIRNKIEAMNKFNQIEVLRMLYNGKAILNENNYGVFVNMSNLNMSLLTELTNYISYVETQEENLNDIEKQKSNYINTYFNNNIKDNGSINSNNVPIQSQLVGG
uniref:NET domain-containing protein n=1 Tax=viral metagenome TaxID=1070528 RepID=A0A6C0LKG2_9ZZZZ